MAAVPAGSAASVPASTAAQLRQKPADASQHVGHVKRRHSRQKWNAPWNGSREMTSALSSTSGSSARIPTRRPTLTRWRLAERRGSNA
jgi:hypothetical protein